MSEELKKSIREQLRPRNVYRIVVGHSTRFVIATAVTKLIQPEKTADKVRTSVGGYVLGGLVAEHTENYALRQYDKMIEIKEAVEVQTLEAFNTDTPTE